MFVLTCDCSDTHDCVSMVLDTSLCRRFRLESRSTWPVLPPLLTCDFSCPPVRTLLPPSPTPTCFTPVCMKSPFGTVSPTSVGNNLAE